MDKFIPRYFLQTSPKERKRPLQPEGSLSAFYGHHGIVVLGEPGLGKTETLKNGAKEEANAIFVRVGEFLSTAELSAYEGKVLYLDGLDEHRSRSNGEDVIDAIIAKLRQLGLPKFRISCRTAEWHGGKDLAQLSAVTGGKSIVQLELQPLTQDDLSKLLPNSEDFVEGAKENHLSEFLKNPQDAQLLYSFYQENNSWPSNRSELMEGACKVLLQENNTAHSEAIDDWVTDQELDESADYLSAILMMSQLLGISSKRSSSDKSYPCIQAFGGDNLYALKAATRRNVFRSLENNRIEPKHRKIAEYMAGRYLASRVRQGVPISRVLALITGHDGGVAPDLRGLYAWLVSLLGGMADLVLKHDPYGAIIYGDPFTWTPNTKVTALRCLQNHTKKDPWFRGQDWSSEALGGLSCVELVGEFSVILREDKCDSHLMGTVLDSIASGPPLEEIGDELMSFIKNPSKPSHLKGSAIHAFYNAVPARRTELVNLLPMITSGDIEDKDQYLWGALLNELYPDFIPPENIVQYLVPPCTSLIGSYHMFIHYEIFERTDFDGLVAIAESITRQRADVMLDDDFEDRRFNGALIRNLLQGSGEQQDVEQLYAWLILSMNEHHMSGVSGEDAEAIRSFFDERENLYIELFWYYFHRKWDFNERQHLCWWNFRQLTAESIPPESFVDELLTFLNSSTSLEQQIVILEIACLQVFYSAIVYPDSYLDHLSAIASQNNSLTETLSKYSSCEIERWRQEESERRKERLEAVVQRRARDIENITPHREEIESGKAVAILEYYSRIWRGLFTDISNDLSPEERLRGEVGPDWYVVITTGIRNSVHTLDNFHTIDEIAEQSAKNSHFYRAYLFCTAIDLIQQQGGKEAVLALDEKVLRLAVAYSMAPAGLGEPDWLKWIWDRKSGLARDVVQEYWLKELEAGADRLSGFYEFNGDELFVKELPKLLIAILESLPKPPTKLLKALLVNLFKFTNKSEQAQVVSRALQLGFSEEGQKTLWVAAGYLVNPDLYRCKLRHQLKKNETEKWYARSLLVPFFWSQNREGELSLSILERKGVVELLASHFKNVGHEANRGARWIGEWDEPSAADEIRRMINSFSQEASNDAAESLEQLINNPNLSEWKVDIQFSSIGQVRTAREARFTYPDVSKVVRTLSNREPANPSDLKALLGDALTEIAEEIRHGNTDGYKAFWNLDNGKATDVHINENTARDRVLEYLRSKLKHLDIVIEPEALYADEKRADIAVYSKGMKLPIEIKRDDHAEVWTAAENQLKRLYLRDPASEGNGIYLVFWFDGQFSKNPPNSMNRPVSAEQMRYTLEELVPESSSGLIDVVVIDVSVPEEKKAKKKSPHKPKRRRKSEKNSP